MAEIRKKTWPEYFQKIIDRKKNVELRLADFDLKEGDILILEEYDPKKKKYTGRVIKKKVKNLSKINLGDFYSTEEIKKFGVYIAELE